jgi:hypothetical protein
MACLIQRSQRASRPSEDNVGPGRESNVAGEIAAVSLVRNEVVPELAFHLAEPVRSGQLIINLRAGANPEVPRQQKPFLERDPRLWRIQLRNAETKVEDA